MGIVQGLGQDGNDLGKTIVVTHTQGLGQTGSPGLIRNIVIQAFPIYQFHGVVAEILFHLLFKDGDNIGMTEFPQSIASLY